MNIQVEDNHEAIGLLMTYRCNLDCQYCYIQKKRDRDMTLDKAMSILSPLLNSGEGLLDITFMGGETLLAMNVIRPLAEWLESNKWRKRYRLFGATNGTLLTDNLKSWLIARRDYFTLALSYDGTPTAQSSNRTSQEIDLDFFINTWPKQPIQMTINKDSVSEMAKGVIYLLEQGAVVHPNVAFEDYEWDKYSIIEYCKQLDILADYYYEHENLPSITQFEHNLNIYAKDIDQHRTQLEVCGAGHGFKVYDVDGKIYPCHLMSPLVLGEDKLELIKYNKIEETEDFADPMCSDCPYTSNCPTCIGCNLIYRNDIKKRDQTHCKIMRAEVRAFLKAEVRILKEKKVLDSSDARLIKSIKRIYEYEKTHFFL